MDTKKVVITREIKWLNKMYNKKDNEKRISTVHHEDHESP